MALSAVGVYVALLAVLAASLLLGLGSRPLGAAALLFLAAAGALGLTGAGAAAGTMATVAFYLLVATVVVILVESADRRDVRRAVARLVRARLVRWSAAASAVLLRALDRASAPLARAAGRFRLRLPRLPRLPRFVPIPFLAFLGLALAVTLPFFAGRYLFALDMVFGPNMDWTRYFFGTGGSPGPALLWQAGMAAWQAVLPVSWFQKLALTLGLATMGWGMYRIAPAESHWARAFAGVLYVLNPFVFVRLLSGQYLFLVSLAALPFAFDAFERFLRNGRPRTALAVALLLAATGAQVHMLALAMLLLAARAAWAAWDARQVPADLRAVGRRTGAALVAVGAAHAFWWVPFLVGTGVGGFTTTDIQFFTSRPTSNLGVGFDLLSMYGFWRPGYTYPKDELPLWWAFVPLFLYLAVHGAVARWSDVSTRSRVRAVATASAAALAFAVFAASPFTREGFRFLFEHIAVIGAFRDSQKFVALLVFGYAYLGAAGVDEILRALRGAAGRARRGEARRALRLAVAVLGALLLLAPAVNANTMLWGYQGQLRASDYPDGWYEARDYLNRRGTDFAVLFLPWHQYADFSFVRNQVPRIANPAAVFFEQEVVQGDNWELPGSFTVSEDPVSRYVERVIFGLRLVGGNPDGITNLGSLLSPLNVRYVLLAQEADPWNYAFLEQQHDLRPVLRNRHVTLYENEVPTARAWVAHEVVHVETPQELAELARHAPLNRFLVRSDGGPRVADYLERANGTGPPEWSRAEARPVGRAAARVEWEGGGWLVVALPQRTDHDGWALGGRPPDRANLDGAPAFEVSEAGGGWLVYRPFFSLHLSSYLVSGLTALLLLALDRRLVSLATRRERAAEPPAPHPPTTAEAPTPPRPAPERVHGDDERIARPVEQGTAHEPWVAATPGRKP